MPLLLTNSPGGTDLITTTRASQIPSLSDLNTSNPDALAALITAASRAIERACKRIFAAQDYTLFLSVGPRPCDWIALPYFPVLAVTRLATNPQAALKVTNTDAGTNQRATMATTATALRLLRVAAGVSTSVDLAYASYTTLSSLAAAVVALGNGWSATALASFGNFPSVDLRPLQGAMPVLSNPGVLEIYIEELSPWASALDVWDWAAGVPSRPCGWQLDADSGLLVGRFADAPGKMLSLRCDYRAGFETIPADIQQACARLASLILEDEQRNSTVQQQVVGPYTQKYFPAAARLLTNPAVLDLIAPYIDHAKTVGRVWP